MRQSVVDYFAHVDGALFLLAAIMDFIACAGAMIMLGFERHIVEARKVPVRLLAGACLGSGAWASYFLCLLAVHPAALAGSNAALILLSGVCAIGGGAASLLKFNEDTARRWRSSFYAAVILTIAFGVMHALDINAVEATPGRVLPWYISTIGALLSCAALTGAVVLLRWGPGVRRRLAGVSLIFATVMGFGLVSAMSITFEAQNGIEIKAATAPLVLAFLICVLAVGLLVSGLAYLIIDRSNVVTRLTADSMATKLADAALEGLIVHNGELVLEANSRFSWLAGDGTESVRGLPLSDFFDDDALSAIHQTMKEGGEGVFETTLQGGTEVEICTRVYNEETGQFVTAVRDLSMRRRIDSAERANLAKSQFLANMSHELRTPLNAIIGYSEMIVEDSDDKGAVRDASEISIAAKNMLSLVNDVVDLSRIEDGKIDFCFDLCDLNEMTDRLYKRFGNQAQAQGLSLQFDVDESAVDAVIDEKRIEQCLAQLVSNAIKFTEKGGVTIRFFAEDGDFKVMVRDTGIGICPERAGQLFEAFSQGDGSITRRYGGVGVGLALTCRLIALMAGRLELETAEGKGSIFTLIAPSDPDPDMLALCRKAGSHARVITVIDMERDKAA